jgi:hypothetical protein
MIREQAELFIRDTLGCECPPELFQDLGDEVELSDGPLYRAFSLVDEGLLPLMDRVFSVGGRLLVVMTRSFERETVLRFLEAGKGVRDQMGFNRFRLVVITAKPKDIQDITVPAHYDDRVHLHALNLWKVPGMDPPS